MMRKIILFSLTLLPLGLASYALAAEGFVALAPIPGLTTGEVANSNNLPVFFFNNLYKYSIGFAAVAAIVMIIWGGLEIAVNKDSVGKIMDAKGRIAQAVFGLILVLSPALVFGIINPRILDLQLNLTPINLNFTPYTPVITSSPSVGPDIGPRTGPTAGAGFYPTAQPGMWCHSTTLFNGNNYVCAPSESVCNTYGVVRGSSKLSDCILTPS